MGNRRIFWNISITKTDLRNKVICRQIDFFGESWYNYISSTVRFGTEAVAENRIYGFVEGNPFTPE